MKDKSLLVGEKTILKQVTFFRWSKGFDSDRGCGLMAPVRPFHPWWNSRQWISATLFQEINNRCKKKTRTLLPFLNFENFKIMKNKKNYALTGLLSWLPFPWSLHGIVATVLDFLIQPLLREAEEVLHQSVVWAMHFDSVYLLQISKIKY